MYFKDRFVCPCQAPAIFISNGIMFAYCVVFDWQLFGLAKELEIQVLTQRMLLKEKHLRGNYKVKANLPVRGERRKENGI